MTRRTLILLAATGAVAAGLFMLVVLLSPWRAGPMDRAAVGPRAGAESAEHAPTAPLLAVELGARARAADPAAVADLVEEGRGDVWACASCHGEDGGGAGLVPRLAGLPAGYVAKQLHDYRSGRRVNANMQTVARALDDDEILALAAYYGRLEAPSRARPTLGGDLTRGRVLANEGEWLVDVPACFSCHGSLGWGVGDIFPPLAAQHPTYTVRQIVAWSAGTRTNAPVRLMQSVAHGLTQADRNAVADYLATLPPPPAEPLSPAMTMLAPDPLEPEGATP